MAVSCTQHQFACCFFTCSRLLPARFQLYSPAGGAAALCTDQQEQGGVSRGLLLAGKPPGNLNACPTAPLVATPPASSHWGHRAFFTLSALYLLNRLSTASSCGPSCWRLRRTSRSFAHSSILSLRQALAGSLNYALLYIVAAPALPAKLANSSFLLIQPLFCQTPLRTVCPAAAPGRGALGARPCLLPASPALRTRSQPAGRGHWHVDPGE